MKWVGDLAYDAMHGGIVRSGGCWGVRRVERTDLMLMVLLRVVFFLGSRLVHQCSLLNYVFTLY